MACGMDRLVVDLDSGGGHGVSSRQDGHWEWAPAGFSAEAHPAGQAWRWLGDADVLLVLADEGAHEWMAGLHVIHSGQSLSTWSTEDSRWYPLLLAWPNGAPFTIENTVVAPLSGSSEHDCDPETWAFFTVSTDSAGHLDVHLTVEGMPYLILPRDGLLQHVNGAPQSVGLATLTGEQVWHGVTSVELDLPWGGLRLESPETGIPWLQLQGHPDFVEVDFDHSCDAPGVSRVVFTLHTQR